MSNQKSDNFLGNNDSSSKEISENVDTKEIKNTETLTILDGPQNSKVYLVGTAHFSRESQNEVVELIKIVRPNRVVLELCNSRINILKLDEESVLKEAKEMNISKMIQLIKQTSLVHGILHSLLIRIYAKVTEELGLAPGGEFRVAYKGALQIPGCKVILGDMPVDITLSRGFNSLPWYRKLKLAWVLLTTDHKMTKEDIEQLKKNDLLDALLKEFGSSFPEFKKVLIDERDMYLTYSLRNACQPIPNEFISGGVLPACVVGVVGLGHVNGIKSNWNKDINIDYLLKKPKKNQHYTGFGKHLKYSILFGTIGVLLFQYFKQK